MLDKRVFLAIFSHTGEVHYAGLNGIATDLLVAVAAGIEIRPKPYIGYTMLPAGRNSAVADFLASDCTHLVMADNDEGWKAGTICKLVSQATKYDLDVIGVAFPLKQEGDLTFAFDWLEPGVKPVADPATGLIECKGIGTGLICISRRCLEKMVPVAEWYYDGSAGNGRVPMLFEYAIKDHKLYGEDILFCHKWRDLGGRVFVDPSIQVEHIGRKVYSGTLQKWINDLPAEMFDLTRVVHCIASRGRPEQLGGVVKTILRNAKLAETKIAVALDRDDPELMNYYRVLNEIPETVYVSVGPREDSIGALYNRLVRTCPGDIYINGADDMAMVTPGWDEKIIEAAKNIPDGIGAVFFGKMPVQSNMPALMAVTRGLIEKMGYFLQPYTPYSWWTDTWLWEIVRMINRSVDADIDVEYPPQDWKTRGLRDVTWWANFFDQTRPQRAEIARSIIAHRDYEGSPDYRAEISAYIPELCRLFERSNAVLRDSEFVKDFGVNSEDAPADDRYRRIKASAAAMIDEKIAA